MWIIGLLVSVGYKYFRRVVQWSTLLLILTFIAIITNNLFTATNMLAIPNNYSWLTAYIKLSGAIRNYYL